MASFQKNEKQQRQRPGASQDQNLPAPLPIYEVSEGKCKVCQSPHRREIDMMLATGWSQTSVMKHWNQILGEDYFKPNNISNHARKHLTSKDAAVRRIMEERVRQQGIDIESIEGFITTKAAVLDTIIQTGLQNLHQGHTVAEAREVLQAVQLLDKMEAEWKETAIDELMTEFRAFSEAVKEIVPEEMAERIFDLFEAKLDKRAAPVLKPLPPPAEDADVVVEVTEEEDED